MGHDEHRRRRLEQERLDRLAGDDVEVVRRLVEEVDVRGHDAEQRELEARSLAAGQQPDLLEHVVAAEQEPREVAARLAGRDRARTPAARRAPSRRGSPRRGAARGSRAGPGCRTRSRRRAAAARRRSSAGASSCRRRSGRRSRSAPRVAPRGTGRAPRPWPAGSRRPRPRSGRRSRRIGPGPPPTSPEPGSRSLRDCLRRLLPLREQPLEAGLVLVHLRDLAVAPVRLDELALPRDLLLVRVGGLGRERVALLALAVVRGVVAAERREPPIPKLPDPRHGRVEEGAVVRRDEERAGASPEVVLQPLQRAEVEVVRRLVEEEQVGRGDDEAGERRPRLLAAGQARRRARHVRRARTRAPRAPRRRAGRACSRRGSRTGAGAPRTPAPRRGPRARAPRARRPSPRAAPRRGGPPFGRPARP